MAGAARDRDGLDAQSVAAWLRAHPRFLADNPDLYRRLAPPARLHGERFADHMAAMLAAERRHAAAMVERADGVLAAGRAAAGLAARVQDAVLALIAAPCAAECVAGELPAILAIDAAALCVEGPAGRHARALPEGTVAGLMGGRAVLFRDDSDERALLHGEAAPLANHEALVRVPGATPALLALAAREAQAIGARQGAAALTFLGQAVAMALRR